MIKYFAGISLFVCFFNLNAISQQADTTQSINLHGVTVTSFKEEPSRQTSLNITPIQIDSVSRYGNYNLTELIAKTPGVTMLSSGVAITKPVIRGLYGNRVLVLLSGLKFDNQQWQEEHGLGLSDLGLSKVELIKGPMSVLYGTEAIGGIINLVEEQKPALNEQETDFSIKLNSNTYGGLVQGGYKKNIGKRWFRIRAGVENNADYSDGNNIRVLNSRFDGYYLKTSFGFEHRNWISENTYSSSFNRFGFIFNDIYSFVVADHRQSRNLGINPAHMVLLNVLSSENKVLLPHSKLTINAGVQSNERMENEGGGAISLNMHLFSIQYLVKWEKELNEKNILILTNLGTFEDNTNFGARKIVPDAHMEEGNVSVYLETNLKNKIILENGLGAGKKWLRTYFTPTVNNPEKEVHPFSKAGEFYNLFTGMSYLPNNQFNLKLNIATGVRMPNLAELSSDGLHEGIFTYEIGSPFLKNEQIISANLLMNYQSAHFELSVSPFYNHFLNYVYLAPTSEEWFGFPVYRYFHQDADQYGTEASVAAKPIKQMQIGVSYAGMISKTEDGNYTPYIPAHKITPFLFYDLKLKNTYHFFSNGDLCLAQDHLYPGEIATPQYFIWNAGVSTSIDRSKVIYDIGIAGNNLLNKAYYDHLSRFKYFDLLNIGRNIAVTLKVKFKSAISKK